MNYTLISHRGLLDLPPLGFKTKHMKTLRMRERFKSLNCSPLTSQLDLLLTNNGSRLPMGDQVMYFKSPRGRARTQGLLRFYFRRERRGGKDEERKWKKNYGHLAQFGNFFFKA